MGDWFDELELDPDVSWRRMGTRSLGDRPWLFADGRNTAERDLRRHLFDTVTDDVFVAAPTDVGSEVLALVHDHVGIEASSGLDPLASAGLAVQEDLCLLRRREDAWHLDAAFVCFPSRWRLADKIGRPLAAVHGPTPGYGEHLAAKVDLLLDRLTDRPVLRRNWFVHPDPALHQPSAPTVDPVIAADRVLDDLHLRSERQTLRKLSCGWVLFTIRIQHDPLGVALSSAARRRRFADYVAGAASADLRHRGMAPAQVSSLRDALGIPSTDPKSDTTSDS